MGKGKKWGSERSVYRDHISGATVTQWTDYMAHNFHLYFTNCGWYDNGSKLLFCSDRENATNLYSLDLVSGGITQLTDFGRTESHRLQNTFVNPLKHEAYFSLQNRIVALNLDNLEERVIYHRPDGYRFGNLSCTADGRNLCFALVQDMSKRLSVNRTGGYAGFEEMEAMRPHCQICLLSLDRGETRVVHEDRRWIGHINTSPTQPHLLTFCHEGPWEKVDHRIWVLNIETREVWKIRDNAPGQYAGHEYWHADGIRIGYHGFTGNLEQKEGKFLGSVRYDNTDLEEFEFPYQNMHIHSNDAHLIVGDGQQASAYHGAKYQDCLFLWKKNGDKMEGPRILCKHRGSFHVQKLHVHPRFSPDGTKVLFTSDMSGYGNLYMVDVPPFESLPPLEDVN